MGIDTVLEDLRFGLRLLRRDPVFAVAASLSLAIGIGANTTIFTIANSLLFRDPPGVSEPGRLVDISRAGDGFGVNEISFPNLIDLRERVTTLEDVCGYQPVSEPVSVASDHDGGGAERAFGIVVTPNYFAVLGVRPIAGRLFDPKLEEPAVVLSHRFWSRRFGKDPGIIGRSLKVNGEPLTVVGITEEQFLGTSMVATDLWTAVSMNPPQDSFLRKRELYWGVARGRLKSGASVTEAAAEIDAIGRGLEREYPEENQGKQLRLAAASALPGNLALPVSGIMTLTLAFVSLALAVACANLAGLLLARGSVRRREIAVRLALGAGRARLVRQLLTETTALFALGGVLGIALARIATSLIISMLPALPLPLEVSLPLDVRVMVFTLAVSLFAAVACGLAPALETSKADVMSTLKNEAPGTSGRSRLRNRLVVAQVAFSVVLIVGAGVFVRALQKAASSEPGFDMRGVELIELDLSLAGYTPASGPPLVARLAETVRTLSNVEHVTAAATLPTSGGLRLGRLALPGAEVGRGRPFLDADWNAVQPGYFQTLRIPFVAGRDFELSDAAGAQSVAIVSEGAARTFWPGQEPLGKYLLQHPTQIFRGQSNTPKTLLVIGVARDIGIGSGRSARPHIYVPLAQQYVPRVTVVVRAIDNQSVGAAVRAMVGSLDPNLPILASRTLEESAAFGRMPQRVAASVSGGLGLVSLVLATIGIYGVIAYALAQRSREIGIRMALGATNQQVVRMMVGVGMKLVIVGSIIGLTVAGFANWFLPTVLDGFPPVDLAAFASAVGLFLTIGWVACYLPARHASRLGPAAALRRE